MKIEDDDEQRYMFQYVVLTGLNEGVDVSANISAAVSTVRPASIEKFGNQCRAMKYSTRSTRPGAHIEKTHSKILIIKVSVVSDCFILISRENKRSKPPQKFDL